jgi:hypothetical protein
MKKLIIITCFFAFLSPVLSQNYTLKGLKSINVVVIDSENLIPQDYENEIIVNSKIALAQTGLKVTEKNNMATLQIKINAHLSESFADPRIAIRFNLIEKVELFRSGKLRSEAITYQTFMLFASDRLNLSKTVSDLVLNSFIPSFLNTWIDHN